MEQINLKEIERETYRETIEGRNVHNDLKGMTQDELRDCVSRDRFPFDVFVINLTGDLNIGTIIRSAILHGAEKVWIFGRRKYDKRGAVGAYNYIDVESIFGFENSNTIKFDAKKFKQVIEENNLFPVFVEQGGTVLQDFDWNLDTSGKKLALVLGNETNGIPDDFMDVESTIVSIPQRGVIRSFNVSSAMNIVAWDMRLSKKWF